MNKYSIRFSPKKSPDLVEKLGTDRVMGYKTEDYVEVIQGDTDNHSVDVVFDTIGGKTIQQSFDILRPFGRLASIVDIEIPQSLLATQNRNLSALRQLIEREQLKPIIDSIMPWRQVSQALQRLEQGGTTGKIALGFSD